MKTTLTVRVSGDTWLEVQGLAKRAHCTPTEIVRKAITQYVQAGEEKEKHGGQ